MELDELKTMWLNNDPKLENKISLNELSLEKVKTKKVASKLLPLYIQRIIESIFHLMAISLLVIFLINNINHFPYAASAWVLLAFYLTTFISALKQINIIKTLDNSNDLATTQSSLVRLQSHILNYAKLTVLFIPTFLAYPVIITKMIHDYNIKSMEGFDILKQSNGNWWTVQWIAFMVLIPLGLWFYNQVSYKNLEKKWVKNFIRKSSGPRVEKALRFLKELQSLKEEII